MSRINGASAIVSVEPAAILLSFTPSTYNSSYARPSRQCPRTRLRRCRPRPSWTRRLGWTARVRCIDDFDGAHRRVVRGRRKIEGQRPAVHLDPRDRFDAPNVVADLAVNVEVRDDYSPFDRHVEHAGTVVGPVDFGEVQHHIVGAVRQGNIVGEVAVSLRLIQSVGVDVGDGIRNRRRRSIGDGSVGLERRPAGDRISVATVYRGDERGGIQILVISIPLSIAWSRSAMK